MKDSEVYRNRIRRLFLDFVYDALEEEIIGDIASQECLVKFIDPWVNEYFFESKCIDENQND